MFGYVNICKDELKVKDYNLWRSYYCGLCKCLGKRYNNLVRLGLNYDMTFLAILLSGESDEKIGIKNERCIAHPLNKRPVAVFDRAIEYAADVSVVLTEEKLKDDIKDDKSVKAMIASAPYIIPYKKAEKLCNSHEIRKRIFNISALEKENCKDIDVLANEFGNLMAEIMCPSFISEEKHNSYKNMGYNFGRWIYIIDAVNDFEDDIKKNRYNPFEKIDIEKIEAGLTYTLYKVGEYYMELDLKKNTALIENIIFMGLRRKQESVLGKYLREEKQNESV